MKITSIVVALCLGLLTTLAIGHFSFQLGYEAGNCAARDEMAKEKVTVFVAAEELLQGTILNDPAKQFIKLQVSKNTAPADAITEIRQLEGMIALRTLNKGEICTLGQVAKVEGPLRSPAGERTLTIRVMLRRPSIAEPGMRIDVLASIPSKDDSSKKVTKAIARRTRVLDRTPADKDGKATLTIALWTEEVERLAQIESEKGVTLIARPSYEH